MMDPDDAALARALGARRARRRARRSAAWEAALALAPDADAERQAPTRSGEGGDFTAVVVAIKANEDDAESDELEADIQKGEEGKAVAKMENGKRTMDARDERNSVLQNDHRTLEMSARRLASVADCIRPAEICQHTTPKADVSQEKVAAIINIEVAAEIGPALKKAKLARAEVVCIDQSQSSEPVQAPAPKPESPAAIEENSDPSASKPENAAASEEERADLALAEMSVAVSDEGIGWVNAMPCAVCARDLAKLEAEDRDAHERVCREDAQLDRMQRRNYACPICDLDLNCARLDEAQLTKRLRHIRVCAKANGIADPRQFARIAKSTHQDEADDPDAECDQGDDNFEALMDAVFDEDEEVKENDSARENENIRDDAFSMLMRSSKTQDRAAMARPRGIAWPPKNTAAKGKGKAKRGGKKMWGASAGPPKYPPPQNQVPDCKGFIVDGFRYRFPRHENTFFLTHFHADHYGGIAYRWDEGPIYCTPTTARLLVMRFKVSPPCIHQIKIGGPPVRVKGVDVSALDANHCPGAAMFLFKVRKTGRMHLHTGDLRYDRSRIDVRKSLRIPPDFRLATVFLDTTYLNPTCCFISQQQAISEAAARVTAALRVESKNALTTALGIDGSTKTTLVVVGAYTIGKERCLWGILRACFPPKEKVYVTPSKLRILKCLEDLSLEDLARLTTDKSKARLHLTEMVKLNMPTLRSMLSARYARVVALRPTGHAKRLHEAVSQDQRVRIISVPYSEHSSFTELEHFVADVKAVSRGQALAFVPTVQSVGSARGAGIAGTKSQLEKVVRNV